MNPTHNAPPIPGRLFVIAAPSGAGKTSLVDVLTQTLKNIVVSISHTTRPKRQSEIEGVNYHFVSRKEFEALIKSNGFLEHALIYDQHYGTSKQSVEENLKKGIDVILEIDWQGHQQIKQLYKSAISIFILPPSLEDLEKRLTLRNQDHPESIKERLADAQVAISHLHEFDYIVINEDFEHASHDLKTIVEAERLRKDYQLARYKDVVGKFGRVI